MKIEDICDADYTERFAHYEAQYGTESYKMIRHAVIREMLDEVHVMLRELLKRVPIIQVQPPITEPS